MPDSREEKRLVTAFLNSQQDRIYNLWGRGWTTDEIHRELVWTLRLGWVSYGRLQATIKSWRESSRPSPWPERQRNVIVQNPHFGIIMPNTEVTSLGPGLCMAHELSIETFESINDLDVSQGGGKFSDFGLLGHLSMPTFTSPQQYSHGTMHQSAPVNLMRTSTLGINMAMASANNLHNPPQADFRQPDQTMPTASSVSCSKNVFSNVSVQAPSKCKECGKVEGEGEDWQICHCG